MKNMANTSSRTLRLLSLLQNHRFWPGAELAERLGVSPRTLRRDINRLRDLGYPVRASRGIDGGYQLAAGAALPPLLIDDDEAIAIAVALQTVASEAPAGDPARGPDPGAVNGIAEASVRALAKISQVMPAGLRRHVEALTAVTVPGSSGGGAPPLDPGILSVIALACRDTERVRFGYTAADGSGTDRYVEPYRLVPLGGRWYLVGYDLTRQDWRNFRLDRVSGPPRVTGERFRPRELPARDAAAFVRDSIGRAFAVYDVEVLINAPADRIRATIGRWASVEEDRGDSETAGASPSGASATGGPAASGPWSRVRMTAESLDWPVFALGIVGADFEVVSPPELRGTVGEWATRFARATGTATDTIDA
jgi:predicted DNA-binding transcriptional regulator YafY